MFMFNGQELELIQIRVFIGSLDGLRTLSNQTDEKKTN